jgi:hypothetical protein
MKQPRAVKGRLTRRKFMGAGAMLAAGAHGLYPSPVLADIPDQFDGTSFKLAAPDPNPKYGGVLRMGITNRCRTSTCTSQAPTTTWDRWVVCSTT